MKPSRPLVVGLVVVEMLTVTFGASRTAARECKLSVRGWHGSVKAPPEMMAAMRDRPGQVLGENVRTWSNRQTHHPRGPSSPSGETSPSRSHGRQRTIAGGFETGRAPGCVRAVRQQDDLSPAPESNAYRSRVPGRSFRVHGGTGHLARDGARRRARRERRATPRGGALERVHPNRSCRRNSGSHLPSRTEGTKAGTYFVGTRKSHQMSAQTPARSANDSP